MRVKTGSNRGYISSLDSLWIADMSAYNRSIALILADRRVSSCVLDMGDFYDPAKS